MKLKEGHRVLCRRKSISSESIEKYGNKTENTIQSKTALNEFQTDRGSNLLDVY